MKPALAREAAVDFAETDEHRALRAAVVTRGQTTTSAPVARFRELLTEAARLGVERYELPNLRALNFVVAGLLAPGVAATTCPDAQAKGLGEYLRSRTVLVPEELAGQIAGPPAGDRRRPDVVRYWS